MVALADCGLSLRGGSMARNLREVIAAVQAERRAKIAAAYRQKLTAKKKKRQLEEAKRHSLNTQPTLRLSLGRSLLSFGLRAYPLV